MDLADETAILVFTRDGDVMAFGSASKAGAWMESIDVLDGEYEAAYAVDGRRAAIAAVRNGPVSVTVTSNVDRAGLVDLLTARQDRLRFQASPDSPRAVATELLSYRRDRPRLFGWLRRRHQSRL